MVYFSDLIICGAVRNIETVLPASLATLDKLMAFAENARSFIVTNDNCDKTDAILCSWSDGHPERRVIRLDGLLEAYPTREDRLAIVRNFYLRDAMASGIRDQTILIVLDLDGPNINLDLDAMVAAIDACTVDWSALFANQTEAYYDIFALRHPVWCPDDCGEQVQRATTFPFRQSKRSAAIRNFIRDRQYKITADHPPIEVDSAFGGLGIYKAKALTDCWYGSRSDCGKVHCEHFFLHKAMKSRGARLFILPNLLNEAPAEHLGPESGAPFPYRFD